MNQREATHGRSWYDMQQKQTRVATNKIFSTPNRTTSHPRSSPATKPKYLSALPPTRRGDPPSE